MKRKSQVLIIFLWILASLTIITVSLGSRISMFIKFAQSRKEILKAGYLAYAGVNRAIALLDEDKQYGYDALGDGWANNQAVFEKIRLNGNPGEYAAVISEEGGFGVIDEDRKININQASAEELLSLLDYYNIPSAGEIVENMLIWRDANAPDPRQAYNDLGYPRKGKPYANIAELLLVKGMQAEDLRKISPVITVSGAPGGSRVNINTASADVIKILLNSIVRKNNNYSQRAADNVANKFITENNRPVYKNAQEIPMSFSGDEAGIFNEFINKIKFSSDYFLIEVIGNAGKIKAKLKVVYDRQKNRLESWYEG